MMEFAQPFMLWGMLAVAIPVFIHFWNKKKGVVMEWAAMQWLSDKSRQQHRGMRLDDLLLLVLRCLLLILLAFLLSRPILQLPDKTGKVHLVEPRAGVVENYRFELEEALKKGEQVYWASVPATTVKDLSKVPSQQTSALTIQKSINSINMHGQVLDLYLTNNGELTKVPAIYVPGSFNLHPVIVAAKSAGRFEDMPKVYVLVDYKNAQESRTVLAALNALVSVYAFPIRIDTDKKPMKKYDWVLTDQKPAQSSPNSLYVLSGQNTGPIQTANMFYSSQPFQIQASDIVSSGRLPEWLGEKLIGYYQLAPNQKPLINNQLNALFVSTAVTQDPSWESGMQKWLMAAFVCLLLAERIIALKKINV